MPYTPGKETHYLSESVRVDDYLYMSTTGEDENLKEKIKNVATGLHKAMLARDIDLIVAQNATITLLAMYGARQSQGDAIGLDEICDAYAEIIKMKAHESFDVIYNSSEDVVDSK